jgi:RNA polymerase sigma factor (sigma-70 family)
MSSKDSFDTNQLIEANMGLVKSVMVQYRYRKLAQFRDLREIGQFALVQAAMKFDACRGVKFESYAKRMIRWRIQDELRKYDPMSRSQRRYFRKHGHPKPERPVILKHWRPIKSHIDTRLFRSRFWMETERVIF